jgi:hypothetical protein
MEERASLMLQRYRALLTLQFVFTAEVFGPSVRRIIVNFNSELTCLLLEA